MSNIDKNLPQGWASAKLKEISLLRNEKIEPNRLKKKPYISLEHIESESNHLINHGYSEDVKSLKSVFYAGDVLYGKLRPYLNKVSQPNFDGICSTDILIFGPSTAIENRFLLKLLSQRSTVDYANSHAKGINLPRISPTDLGELMINLPPLNEQKRIATRIEELQARSRHARVALEAMPELLDQLRQSLLAAAFRGDLTKDWREKHSNIEPATELLKRIRAERRKYWEEAEREKLKIKGMTGDKFDEELAKRRKKYKEPAPVDTSDFPKLPGGWCVTSIDAVAFVTKLAGFEYTKYVTYDPDGDLSVIKAENAGKYGFKRTEFSKVRSETIDHLTRSNLRSGDLLMVFVGSVGQVAMVPDDQKYFLGPNSGMIRIKSRYVIPAFVEFFLRSPIGFSFTMSFAKAVTQPSLSMGAIRLIPLFIPPLEEQKIIVEKLKMYIDIIKESEEKMALFFKSLRTLDQSILSKAFCGELVPQDPNDEPASILLERIRQEKANTMVKPKAKRK